MKATFKDIVNTIERITLNHELVNSFGFGNISDIQANEMTSPIVWVHPQMSIKNSNINIFKYDIYILDLLEQNKANLLDITSDTVLIGNNIVTMLSDNGEDLGFFLDNNNITIEIVEGKFDSFYGGVVFSVEISTAIGNFCNIPTDGN